MKEEEKLKVGRPKLADDVTKTKALSFVAIAVAITSVFVVIGTSVMFGAFNVNKLKGETSCTYVNPTYSCPSGYTRSGEKCTRTYEISSNESCGGTKKRAQGGTYLCTVTQNATHHCSKGSWDGVNQACKICSYSGSSSSSSGSSSYSSGGSSTSYKTTTTKSPLKSFFAAPKFTGIWYEGEETEKFKIDADSNTYVDIKVVNNSTGIEVVKLGDYSASKNSWKIKFKKEGSYTLHFIDKNRGKTLFSQTYKVYKKSNWTLSSSIVGDVNGDKKITTDDVSAILKFTSKTPYNSKADLNGDKKVDSKDARILSNVMEKYADINGDKKIDIDDYKIIVRFENKYGDVNKNKIVTTYDGELVLKYSAKQKKLSSEQVKLADVNNDGKADAKDARLIIKYADLFNKQTIKLPVVSPDARFSMKVGTQTDKFKFTVSGDAGKVSLVSSDNKGLQVIKYGDNTVANNLWALKAKKKGTYKVTAKAESGISTYYYYTVK